MSFECQRVLSFLLWGIFLLPLIPRLAQSHEVSPDKKFVVIRTPHFEVIVNAKQQEMGQYYSKYLETSYDFLKPLLKETPDSAVVILNDKTDSSNGYATRVPYPHIMIYPVLPSDMESLAESGHWPLELVTHEYTHLLSFEASSGPIGFLRNIFGSVMSPNILLPNWWKEGIAVQMETMVGEHGRLRSIYQEAVLRALFLENRLRDYDIAEINEVIPTWPEGMRSYLFGSLMWSQMVADHGPQIMNDLTYRHGRRIPYFLNGAAEDLMNESYGSKYNTVLDEVSRRLDVQIEELKKLNATPTQPIQSSAKYSLSPTVSPNGQLLAMIVVDEKNNRSVQIYQKSSRKNFVDSSVLTEAEGLQESEGAKKIYDSPAGGSIHRVSWSTDSSQIIYDKLDFVNSVEKFADLYIYNLKNQKTLRLTKSLRAREPAFSPSAEEATFIHLSGSKTSLALINLKTKKVQILKTFGLAEKASSPIFLDAQTLLFSFRNTKGEENLYTYHLKTKKLEKKLEQYPQSRFPVLAKNGFYFSSSKNGTHNIYFSSLDFTNVKPVTHTLTSFLNFTWDPEQKDLYATQITSQGPSVVWIKSDQIVKNNSELPEIKGLLADRYQNKKAEAPTTTTSYPTEEYSSWMKLAPKYWIPFVSTSSQSQGILFQAFTGGFDPLKKHIYNAQAAWDTGIRKPSFSGSYLNNQFWTSWGLQGFQSNSYFVSAENTLTNTGGQISVYPSLWSFNRYLKSAISWKYLSTDLSNATNVKRMGPSVVLNYENISMGGNQISPEEGWSWYLGATQYLKRDNYFEHTQYNAGFTTYWSDWLPKRHAVMVKVNSVYTPEDIASVLGFSTDPLMAFQDGGNGYVMRGYTTGHFLGRTLANMNLEYRFPIRDIYRGSGTDPFFTRRLNAAILVDALSLEGLAYRWQDKIFESVSTNQYFFSGGAELRFETTIGYVLPVTFVVGAYQGLSGAYAPSTQFAFNLQFAAQF